ncbi:MAG: NAD-dependent epimerase/dehydratase family protein [Gemmatimonadaceae bacterium]
MRILATGGAGFIGRHVVRGLLDRGHHVCVVDTLLFGQEPPREDERCLFHQRDVRDARSLHDIFALFRPTLVMHLAAIHHIPTCEQNPTWALDVNVIGTQVVLNAAQAEGCARLVFASTGAVYDWTEGPLTPGVTPTRPRDVYSVSKVANEWQLAVWQARVEGTVTIARIFNTVGPGDRNAHLIPEVLSQLRQPLPPSSHERVVQIGNSEPKRDYICVEDTATALVAMAEADLGSGTHFLNVGTGVEHSVLEIVESLASALGVAYRVEVDPRRVRGVDRLHQCADIRDTIKRLRWRPRWSLADALRRVVSEG